MSNEEERNGISQIMYTVPPSVDSKTWADIQSKWIDVRLREIETEKEKTEVFAELAKEAMNTLKDYYLKKIPKISLPAYILVGIVVGAVTFMTWLNKVSGETFAFLMGTVVGYIITLLSKRT